MTDGVAMRLYGIRIFVDDFEQARAFYGGTLQLRENWAMPEANAAGYDLVSGELIVEQQDADTVEFQGPPERQSWGGTLAHFKDPAGNILTLLG